MLIFFCADIITRLFYPIQGMKCPVVFRRLSEVAMGVLGRYPFPAGAEKLLYCPTGGAFGLTLPQHTLFLGHRGLETVKLTNFRLAEAFADKVLAAAFAVNSLIFVFHNQYSLLNKNRFTVVFIFRL